MRWFLSSVVVVGIALTIPNITQATPVEIDRSDVVAALSGCPVVPLREYFNSLNMQHNICIMRALQAIGCTEKVGRDFSPSLGRALVCMRVVNGQYGYATSGGGAKLEDLRLLLSGYVPDTAPDLPIMGLSLDGPEFNPEAYIHQNGLKLLGCTTRPIDGQILPEELACFKEAFDLTGVELQGNEVNALRYAGQSEDRREALETMARHGFRQPRAPKTSPAATAQESQKTSPRPTLSTKPRPIGSAFALGSPTDEDIRQAMERHLMIGNTTLNAIKESCDNFRRSENPFLALGCLTSAAMGMDSEEVGVHVTAVDAKKCVMTEDEEYICEVSIRRSGNMGNNPYVQASMDLYLSGEHRPIGFKSIASEWRVEQLYTECTYLEKEIRCKYFE